MTIPAKAPPQPLMILGLAIVLPGSGQVFNREPVRGLIFVFFILTVAAAESAIGLALLVLLFRNKSSINVDELNSLKG